MDQQEFQRLVFDALTVADRVELWRIRRLLWRMKDPHACVATRIAGYNVNVIRGAERGKVAVLEQPSR